MKTFPGPIGLRSPALHSVLILGADAIAAALPGTPVQLVHACHRWGFSTVVPASWGDELLASEVIKRCATRESRPAIQCSCPRVAERLGAHAAKLDDSIFWLATPPVAAAQYIRAFWRGADIHVTYAGACPGAADASIDQRITPTELLLALTARGIDISAQPMVFENIIPPDRRRHFSAAAGTPDAQRLWQLSAFRLAQPTDTDLSMGIAQLLLAEERVLIDLAPSVGCICRAAASVEDETAAVIRSPTPVVSDGVVDVARSAPALREPAPRDERVLDQAPGFETVVEDAPDTLRNGIPHRRQSQAKVLFRRQAAWRRQTPRPGALVARTSSVVLTISQPPLLQRREIRVAIATAIAIGILAIGVWLGRQSARAPNPLTGAAPIGTSALLSRSR